MNVCFISHSACNIFCTIGRSTTGVYVCMYDPRCLIYRGMKRWGKCTAESFIEAIVWTTVLRSYVVLSLECATGKPFCVLCKSEIPRGIYFGSRSTPHISDLRISFYGCTITGLYRCTYILIILYTSLHTYVRMYVCMYKSMFLTAMCLKCRYLVQVACPYILDQYHAHRETHTLHSSPRSRPVWIHPIHGCEGLWSLRPYWALLLVHCMGPVGLCRRQTSCTIILQLEAIASIPNKQQCSFHHRGSSCVCVNHYISFILINWGDNMEH